MHRILLPSLLVVLSFAQAALAQDVDFREEMRFAEALRERGDHDLAREIIQKLRKIAPADVAKELALEEAKTSLRMASDEPETARRLRLYREARADLQKFIDGNPGHPRIAEANLDIARVLNLTGKTELNQALLAEDQKTQKELAQQARGTLVQAAAKLTAAEKALEAEKKKKATDVENISDASKKKVAAAELAQVEQEYKQTQLERALNLYDQASTYIGTSGFEASSKLLVEAKKLLQPLADGASRDPVTHKATAWVGRIVHQIDRAETARTYFEGLISAGETPINTEGVRLARYFRLLVIKAQPTEKDKDKSGTPNRLIISSAEAWRQRYPKFLKTPEGSGLTFLLAETYYDEANRNKAVANQYRQRARALLREVELSENEFTERARRLKIRTIAQLGGFSRKIEELNTFEDCYIRAQYEAYQLSQDPETELKAQQKRLPNPTTITDPKERKQVEAEIKKIEAELSKVKNDPDYSEKRRKTLIESIMKALTRGLKMPEVAKMKANLELDNARAMMAFWSLNTGKLEDAIRYGEGFARESPRASQAANCAVYAIRAYTDLLAQKQAKFAEDAADFRLKLFDFASYVEDRWPGEMAGEMAGHTIALQMLREKNYREAIKKLSTISPSYANYTLARYQLADTALKAEGEKLEPLTGDRPGDYRKRAILALESMPISALGPDPFTNLIHVTGKALLGRELFRFQRYAQMDQIASTLLPRLDKLRFSDDEEKDRGSRAQLKYELVDIQLYARYGQAFAAMAAEDFNKAAALIDPLIDALTKGKNSQEKINLQKNPQLATNLLTTALKANLQLGKIDRVDNVLTALDNVSENKGNLADTLRLLAYLIRTQVEDIRKKNDQAELDTAIKGYSAILSKQIAKIKGAMTPDFIRVLADCYFSMGQHDKAADELGKVTPDPKVQPDSPEDKLYKAIQVLQVRELRLSKKPDNIKKARALMDKMRTGDGKKPGWAMQNLSALIEHGLLLEAEEKWKEAFPVWSGLVKNLVKHVERGGTIKEYYFECYFHMVLCYTKIGLTEPAKADRDKFLLAAARQIVSFQNSWGDDFGSEASRKRFTELLAAEQSLKSHYDSLKKK